MSANEVFLGVEALLFRQNSLNNKRKFPLNPKTLTVKQIIEFEYNQRTTPKTDYLLYSPFHA